MSRPPRIDIHNDGDVIYAMVRGRLVAWTWRVGEYWYVGQRGRVASQTSSERDAFERLMAHATGAREGS